MLLKASHYSIELIAEPNQWVANRRSGQTSGWPLKEQQSSPFSCWLVIDLDRHHDARFLDFGVVDRK